MEGRVSVTLRSHVREENIGEEGARVCGKRGAHTRSHGDALVVQRDHQWLSTPFVSYLSAAMENALLSIDRVYARV